MSDITVSIYGRVKLDNKWTRVPVEIPDGRKRNSRPLLKGDPEVRIWRPNGMPRYWSARNVRRDRNRPPDLS